MSKLADLCDAIELLNVPPESDGERAYWATAIEAFVDHGLTIQRLEAYGCGTAARFDALRARVTEALA